LLLKCQNNNLEPADDIQLIKLHVIAQTGYKTRTLYIIQYISYYFIITDQCISCYFFLSKTSHCVSIFTIKHTVYSVKNTTIVHDTGIFFGNMLLVLL